LVAQVLAKDRKATAEFVARCADWLYSFVRHRLAPRTEMVEDLVQDILLAAWQGLPNIKLIRCERDCTKSDPWRESRGSFSFSYGATA